MINLYNNPKKDVENKVQLISNSFQYISSYAYNFKCLLPSISHIFLLHLVFIVILKGWMTFNVIDESQFTNYFIYTSHLKDVQS